MFFAWRLWVHAVSPLHLWAVFFYTNPACCLVWALFCGPRLNLRRISYIFACRPFLSGSSSEREPEAFAHHAAYKNSPAPTNLLRLSASTRALTPKKHGRLFVPGDQEEGESTSPPPHPVAVFHHGRSPRTPRERIDLPPVVLDERGLPGRDRGVLRLALLLGLRGAVRGHLRFLRRPLPRAGRGRGNGGDGPVRDRVRPVLLQLRRERPRLPGRRGHRGLLSVRPSGGDRLRSA